MSVPVKQHGKYKLTADEVTDCISRVGKSSINNFLQLAQLIKQKDEPASVESKTNAISNLQRLKERRRQLINKSEVVSDMVLNWLSSRRKNKSRSTLKRTRRIGQNKLIGRLWRPRLGRRQGLTAWLSFDMSRSLSWTVRVTLRHSSLLHGWDARLL